MKNLLLVALSLSVSGCAYRVYHKEEVAAQYRICRTMGRIEYSTEMLKDIETAKWYKINAVRSDMKRHIETLLKQSADPECRDTERAAIFETVKTLRRALLDSYLDGKIPEEK